MSLILKGIDLPEEYYYISILILKDGSIFKQDENDGRYYQIGREAIQIPKGVRLIDANKLEIRRCDDSASRATFDYVDEWDLEDAPTILESEEEE